MIWCNNIVPPWISGNQISEKSMHVKINSKKVKEVAVKTAECFFRHEHSLKCWKHHKLHPQVADEQSVDFIFTIDTLNFSFWTDDPETKYKVTYKGEEYAGYWSLVAALNRALDEGKPVFNANFMANVTLEDFSHIFRSDSKMEVPMIEERYEAYKEAGKVLLDKYGGSFVNCVRESNGDALFLLHLIVKHFHSYQDVVEFEGKLVAFYKRAQILVSDIWCCFEGKGLGHFHNIDSLTMFADYRVPQTLEYFGILEYSKELTDTLNSHTLLKSGCRYEIEIRGCSIAAVQQLVEETREIIAQSDSPNKTALVKEVNSITVDMYLWDFARANLSEVERLPFHRVRTIYY